MAVIQVELPKSQNQPNDDTEVRNTRGIYPITPKRLLNAYHLLLLGVNKRTGQTTEKRHFKTIQGIGVLVGMQREKSDNGNVDD